MAKCHNFVKILFRIHFLLNELIHSIKCDTICDWICENLPSTDKRHIPVNDYAYFTKVELQLQVNNAVYLLGVASIIRTIAKINFVGL